MEISEHHLNSNCRYEQVKGSIKEKECFYLYRRCECGKMKSVESSELLPIEKDGLSIHFNKNCNYVKKEHPNQRFVLTSNCLCKMT